MAASWGRGDRDTRNGRLRGLAVLAVVTLLSLGGCGDDLPAYRYRLTVEVETPAGLRTGSGVIESQMYQASRNALFPGAITVRPRGEALPVILPGGRMMFVLLSSRADADWAGWIMVYFQKVPREVPDSFRRRFAAMLADKRLKVVPATFPRDYGSGPGGGDYYPWIVRFDDRAKSYTIHAIDPADLAAAFGPGYRLSRITAQLTSDPVTTGLERYLPWILSQGGRVDMRGDRTRRRPLPEQNLSDNDFVQRMRK